MINNINIHYIDFSTNYIYNNYETIPPVKGGGVHYGINYFLYYTFISNDLSRKINNK